MRGNTRTQHFLVSFSTLLRLFKYICVSFSQQWQNHFIKTTLVTLTNLGTEKCNTNTNSWLCANDSWGVFLAVTTYQTTTLLYYRFVFSFQRIFLGIRWLIIKTQFDNIPKCEILRVIRALGTLSTKALTSGTSKRATGSWYFLSFLVL